MDDNVLSKLFSCLSSAADVVKGHDSVHIFSHHDADGISAAAILAKTMVRAGKEFKLTLFRTLNDETMGTVRNCGSGCIIIADMGVSYIDALESIDSDIVVLDHHKGEASPKRIHYANPHSFGMDGMTDGCGASMAMLFSVAYDQNNWDLVQIAFAGIIGDRQHQKGLTGINEYLFTEGKKRGYVTMADGSLIPPGPLMSSLFLTIDPYIRGVSGSADGVTALLEDAKLDPALLASELGEADKRKLSSLIAAKLLKQGVTKETLEDLMAVRYPLKNWSIDAGTLASLTDACGRSGAGGAGVGMGMGDRKCMSEASAADAETRKRVLAAVADIDSEGLVQRDNIQFFDSTSSGLTGVLCEIVMRYIGDPNKPTVCYNTSEGRTKASARCTHRILEKGVDLSVAMKKAGEAAGGGGGGHMVASGAWFETGREKEFIDALDRIVGEQISAK